jgi:Zn-finger nucleic acid-binding protein
MIRARVEASTPFHLERCGLCRGIWFDRGEWQQLAARQFLDHLDDLWDPAWQKRCRIEAERESLDQALVHELGGDLFQQLLDVSRSLEDHPARAQALAWLCQRLER